MFDYEDLLRIQLALQSKLNELNLMQGSSIDTLDDVYTAIITKYELLLVKVNTELNSSAQKADLDTIYKVGLTK